MRRSRVHEKGNGRRGGMHPGIQRQVDLAKRHQDFDEKLVWRIACEPPQLVAVQATQDSRKLYNLFNQVMTEVNRLTCYLRLTINPRGILHATHTPLHQVEDLLVSHFLYRFPRYVIVLDSKRGVFIGRNRTITRSPHPFAQVLHDLEDELPLDPILEELKDTDDDVWEAFYKSQVVKEKYNPQLFLKNVPRRFLSMDTFRVERELHHNTASLGTFLAQDREE